MDAKNKLKSAYKVLSELPFPEFPDDDALSDWLADLVEMDAFYAGLAQSVLSGHAVEYDLHELDSFHQRLATITGLQDKDKKIYEHCCQYLSALDAVRKALLELQGHCPGSNS